MHLSVVVPIFNEEANLPDLGRRLTAALQRLEGDSFTVIYVDDGSADRSVEIALSQHRADPRFALVQLSRNFGREAAILAGLSCAIGDAVVVMDGDLQDPPEVIPDLVRVWREGGQVVRAHRRSRAERGLRRLGFEAFYRVFGLVSDLDIPRGAGGFCLLDRRATDEIRNLPEKNRFFPGIRWWIGFDQRIVEYDRQDRLAGAPKQSLRALFAYAADAIFSFSYRPLRLMTLAGAGIAVAGFGIAAYFVIKRLLGVEQAQMGFTTLVSLLLFLGGVQLVGIGLLGEYLGRVYDEVKRRPAFIVSRYHGVSSGSGPEPGSGS